MFVRRFVGEADVQCCFKAMAACQIEANAASAWADDGRTWLKHLADAELALEEQSLSQRQAFLNKPVSLQVQATLYNNEAEAIKRAVISIARSIELAREAGLLARAHLAYGDSSPSPCLSEKLIIRLQSFFGSLLTISYDFFSANLGSAAGHNRLAKNADSDFLLLQNPDVIPSPRLLEYLIEPFAQPGVGMTEPKQLPIEHPKDYDRHTGETSWATGACCLIPTTLFRDLGGYDADSFFLYCDDVDLAWRVRLAGYKVIFQPAAMIFHDKRLSPEGRWQPSAAERYYSAEAALLLAHKWSRPKLVAKILTDFDKSGDGDMLRAAATFRERKEQNRLPQPIDPYHKVGQFIGIFYARHRFPL